MKVKVLITVKTYPLPSTSYQELVCTAGVLPDGSFIRLYPVDYRYQPYWRWYKKYQWIEVDVEKHDRDPRKESYRPKMDTLRPLGEPLDTKNKWAERKKYVLAQRMRSMEELYELQERENVSLGIVRPKRVLDLVLEDTEREWKPDWQALFLQQRLFGPQQKPLEKIPFRFSYRFACDDPRCKGNHEMMIEDWELGQLFLTLRDSEQSEQVAVQKVKDKFLGQMCAPHVDTHFFVGTTLQYGKWIVLGVFWPKT